jgi:hypothetical protein
MGESVGANTPSGSPSHLPLYKWGAKKHAIWWYCVDIVLNVKRFVRNWGQKVAQI